MPIKPQGRIFNDITETIGGTPLVRINRLIPKEQATVLVKCEFFNPLGSVKDRIGVAMIDPHQICRYGSASWLDTFTAIRSRGRAENRST